MFKGPLYLIGAVFLATTFAQAQDEQSASSALSASARYWTAARVQQEPPRNEPPRALATAINAAQSVRIDNELLAVTVQSDDNGLAITDKASGHDFITGGDFNASGGTV